MSIMGITRSELLSYLKEYAATQSSLTRYAQKGLILYPCRTKKFLPDGSRVLYHPIVPIEFIAATCLKQEYNIDAISTYVGRIGAFNEALYAFKGDDIFCDTMQQINYEHSFCDYHIRYKGEDYEVNTPILEADIDYRYKTIRSDMRWYIYDRNTKVTDAHIKYLSEIYKYVFMKTYDKYWDSIKKHKTDIIQGEEQ